MLIEYLFKGHSKAGGQKNFLNECQNEIAMSRKF